jgi:translation initiation factor IF-3
MRAQPGEKNARILVDGPLGIARYFCVGLYDFDDVDGLPGTSPGGCVSSPLQERKATIDRVQTRVNEQIRISPIRVISEEGEQLGILPTEEALTRAREAGLDLVEVAPNERPPVCRIMDYGKYKYDKSKKQKHATHQTRTKEIRLRPKTGTHDIDFKVKQAVGFLKHKDKVQVTVIFRGREMAHIEEGRKVMEGVIKVLEEHGKLESPPSQHARRMMCTIAPK